MKTTSVAALFILLPLISPGFGHGTRYEILNSRTMGIKATFDSGDPIALATVLIFAPQETKPCRTTQTDSAGIFYFTPDRPGGWVLQVREKGGHGMRINLDIDDSLFTTGDNKSGSATSLQKILMALCVVWGCVGTALYFKKRAAS